MEPQKTIKILLVLPFFYPHRGGSQKYAEELYAIMMKNHENVLVDVLAYNTDNVADFEDYRGFRVHRIPCWNVIPARFALANPFALIKKLKELSKNNYDFVNTHIRFFDPTWWLWSYGKKIHAKSIFTGHVAVHPVHGNKIVELLAKFADLTLAKWALQKYDILTFTNKTAIKFFKERLGVKDSNNVLLVYGGVDTSFFRPQEKTNRIIPKINLNITDDKVIVTYVGRMIWSKGITFYYEALKLLKKQNPQIFNKCIFVLGGPGVLEEEIKNNIKNDGLEKNVLMSGNLNYEQVRDLLAISDIFINPSNHSEGFPNTVLEAGAAGAYVIATDNAGTWEVVENGNTGSLVPQKDPQAFAEATIWAVNNKEKRLQIADNFRQRLVKEFDWNVISNEFYEFLKQQS